MQTICLSMIVRDECAVIDRCLESVKPHIDFWAIRDTGSTDGTQGLVRRSLSRIPGSLTEAPEPRQSRLARWLRPRHFDFAAHRNAAIAEARKTGADYILVLDADEELVRAPDSFRDVDLGPGRYVARFRLTTTGQAWYRTLLFRADEPWRYIHPIHERLVCDDPALDKAAILHGVEVHSHSDGGRNADPREKYLRDARHLRSLIRQEPNDPRHWYYLAQSYAGAGELLKALRTYEIRSRMDGWDEERWYSEYQMAALKEMLGYPWRDVLEQYLRAFNLRPWRAEPLWAAGMLSMSHGDLAIAEVYLRHACQIPRPSDVLLVNDEIYEWRLADDLAGCLARMGRRDECLGILRKLHHSERVPEPEKDRIAQNIELAEAA